MSGDDVQGGTRRKLPLAWGSVHRKGVAGVPSEDAESSWIATG